MDINTITYPSKISGLTSREYHSSKAWSKSGLDKVHKSPAHFFTEKSEESAALTFGRALHCAILEPDKFNSAYTLAPKVDKRTNAGKTEWAAFELDCSIKGKEIISFDDMMTIRAMYDSIMSHPLARNIFKDGESELSFFWKDHLTGLQCRCRPDYYRRDGILVDLKTTASAAPHEFARSFANYRYHVQAAFYTDGVFNVSDFSTFEAPTDFLLVAVEKEPPYGLRVYRVDDRAMEFGRAAYKADLQTILEFDGKPDRIEYFKTIGYTDSIEISELSLPSWAE